MMMTGHVSLHGFGASSATDSTGSPRKTDTPARGGCYTPVVDSDHLQEAVELEENRRSGPRSVICLPVSVKTSLDDVARPVHLRDMSARGIAMFADFVELDPKSQIEVIVSVPYEISLTEAIEVRLCGQIIRVDNDSEDRKSIAAALFPISAPGHA
ncbi:MAG: type pilus assembly PilZ [Acidobacteriales bacterium]|nr:type pilus assembly PilZ [Terriglobales bacterium]